MIVILVSELGLGTQHRDAVLRIIRNRSKAQIYDGHSGPLFISILLHNSEFRFLNSEFRNLHCEFRNSEFGIVKYLQHGQVVSDNLFRGYFKLTNKN